MTMTTTARPNRYAGSCNRCGEYVPAGAGRLAGRRVPQGRWVVAHTDGDCPDQQPAPLGPMHGPVSIDERIATASARNRFVAEKVAIVRAATTLDEARDRIGRSCQGMTMDYMGEFCQESAAAALAQDLAKLLFA